MRKTLIQTLLAAFCATLCAAPLEGGGVMLINMRNAMLSGGKRTPTAKDYVQDGLIAMWDGIENAGWGVHEASPSKFVDLIGANKPEKYGSQSTVYTSAFSNDALISQGYRAMSMPASMYNAIIDGATVEWVAERQYTGPTVGTPYLVGNNWLSIAGFVGNRLLLYNRGNALYITPPFSAAPYKFSVAIAVDSVTKSAEVYLNGSRAGTIAAGSATQPSNGGYFIGQNLALVNNNNYFAIFTYSLRVYQGQISADEIAANYAIDKARFNLP